MRATGLFDKRSAKPVPLQASRKGKHREFASTRLIAADIKTMVGFYEMVTGQSAEWLAPVFVEIVTPAATLAIGSSETVAQFQEGSAEPNSTGRPPLSSWWMTLISNSPGRKKRSTWFTSQS
jgi:hypothetical protein